MADQPCNIPLDVWADIFRLAQPSFAVDPARRIQRWCNSTHEAQATFWRLPLVCKAFHDIFTAHPELGCRAVRAQRLSKPWPPCRKFAISFVPWLQARAASIEAIDTGPHSVNVASYLAALSHPCSSLQHIKLQADRNCEVQDLAWFSSLTSCTLSSKTGNIASYLSLSPLSGLLRLSHLSLGNGCFTCISAASRLTHLEVNDARVWGYTHGKSCSFANTLTRMDLECCELIALHPEGLLACTALQSLRLKAPCKIHAMDWGDELDLDDINRIPVDWSSLAALTHLQLEPVGRGDWYTDNHWECSGIASLPNLQHVDIAATGMFDFGQAYQSLCRVGSLTINVKAFPIVCTPQEAADLSPDLIGLASAPWFEAS